jgi:hypothetical protein
MVQNFAPIVYRRSFSEVVTWDDVRISILNKK